MANVNSLEEQNKRSVIHSYHILDTAWEQEYNYLAELAAAICDAPIALVSFVDEDGQISKSYYGISTNQADQFYSFCSHAIQNAEILIQIENISGNPRFQDDPMVNGKPGIRFYAGMPLLDKEGHALGSICVIDEKPRLLNKAQQKGLRMLAKQTVIELSIRKDNISLLKANKQLLYDKERLQSILDTVGEGIGITDEKGNIVYTNNLNREIFKMDEKSMLSLNNISPDWNNRRLDGSPLPAEEHPVSVALQTGASVKNYEFIVNDQLNNSIYLRMNAMPIKDNNGRITGAIGSFADITDSYLMLQQLRDREENLRIAISSANLGTWHMDVQTREFFPSARLKELFGFYPDENMPYDAAVNQIDDSYRQEVIDAVEASITKGEPYKLEYPIIGYHDKKLRWVVATGHLYTHAGNPKVSHFSGTIADITERKLDEQRRSDFIGMVSHELRNPLTAIKAYAYMLKRTAQKNNDEILAANIVKIDNQVNRMEALINGFLDVARLGEGKIRLNRTRFDMAHLVRIAEEESLATITSHKVVFAPVEFTPVEADQDKIEQVLLNFINNAVKYSPSGSIINVACITKNGMAHVYVKDQGMGIPPKDQPFIFDRFYRVESEAMKNKKGFGIGLYICKEIIERHNGQIGVKSIEGQGSTFWFSLPVFIE